MIYGYACIDIVDNKVEIERQISKIRKYGNSKRENISLLGEIVDKTQRGYSLDYKKQLRDLQDNIKEGDTVVFATLDSISTDKNTTLAILSVLYSKGANVVVLDFPVLETIDINKMAFNNTPKHPLYLSILSPLLEYRYTLKQNNYSYV